VELYLHDAFLRHRAFDEFATLSYACNVRPVIRSLFNPGSVKKNGRNHKQRGRKEKNS
jgi:hypothetical protein